MPLAKRIVKKILSKKRLTVRDLINNFESLAHRENSTKCWCNPVVLQACPEDDSDVDGCPPDCWRCNGSSLVPEYDEELTSIIIHQDL